MKKYGEFSLGNESFTVEVDSSYNIMGNVEDIVFVRNDKFGFALSKLDFFAWVSWLYFADVNIHRIHNAGNETIYECVSEFVGDSLLVVDYIEDKVRLTYLWQWILTLSDFSRYVQCLKNTMDAIVNIEGFKCDYYDPIFLANDAYKFVYDLRRIEFDTVCVGDLLIYDERENEGGKLTPIRDGRVFDALEGDSRRVASWNQINYYGMDNVSRCDNMLRQIAQEGYQPEKYGAYMVLLEDTPWIRDGSHRAAALMKKFGNIEVKVARWYRKSGMTKGERLRVNQWRKICKRSVDKERNLPKVIVYGTGDNFKCYYPWFNNRYEIVGAVDGDECKVGANIRGLQVEGVSALRNKDYDYVLVTPNAYNDIKLKLITLGVPLEKILILHEISKASVGKDFVSICFIFGGNMSDYLLNLNYVLGFYKKICNPQCFLDISVDSNVDFMKDLCNVRSFSSVIRDIRDGLGGDKSKYDIIVNIDSRYPEILQAKEDRLVRLLPEAIDYIMQCRKFKIMNKRYFKSCNPAYVSANETSGYYEMLLERKRIQQSDIYDFLNTGNDSYLEHDAADDILDRYGLENRKYITVHTGMLKNRFYRTNIKVWAEDEISDLIPMLHEKYPEYKIALIKNVGQCNVDTKYVDVVIDDDVELGVLKALMKNAALHIDSDDFLVHLRKFLSGGKSVVVFGPTSDEFYGYDENINIRGKLCTIGCEGVSENWESQCMKSSGKAMCMQSIKAEHVFYLIENNGGVKA